MPETDPWYVAHNRIAHRDLDKVLLYEQIDSTNSEARRIRGDHRNKNILLVARQQSQGRGQHGRHWESAKDMGLWTSLVLQDSQTMALPMNLLSLYTGLVLSEVIQPLVPAPILLKWPNDVLIHGRKVAGILIELQWLGNQVSTATIGIGINTMHNREHFSTAIADSATSLQLEQSRELSSAVILQAFVDTFFGSLELLSRPALITSRWNRIGWGIDQDIVFRERNSHRHGRFLGVNRLGQAAILEADGVKCFDRGEISLGSRTSTQF